MKHRTLLVAAAVLAFAGPALANGGGGGGGAALPSSSGPSYDPVEEYQSGVEYLRQQDYRKAERAFKRVVSVARKDANSHLLLGVAHMGQEEWRPASRALKKALRYDPSLHDARGRLAVAYMQMGKADDAQEQVDELNAAKAACAGTCAEADAIDKALAMAGRTVDTSALPPAIEQASATTGDTAYLGAVRLINME
ncbi:MAG: tetratricopeptide repeat protein, partial [Pseudomonadota bacterium]